MQENTFQAFLLTILAGLSTAIGGLLVISFGSPTFKSLGKMLSFSSGVMLYISFVDMFAGKKFFFFFFFFFSINFN